MDDEPGSRWSSGRRVALLLLIGAVLVAATIAATWHVSERRTYQPSLAAPAVTAAADSSGELTTASSPPSPGAAAATPATTATPDGCPAAPVSTALPTSVPADLQWATGGYEPLPYSATSGPLRQSVVGLPECFARSPMGAVIAAWTINADLFSTGWRQALATQVAHTAGYPRLVTELEATPPDSTPGIDSPAGFTVLAAGADTVTVDLVLQGAGNGGLIGCPLTVVWDGQDWQLAPRVDGTLTTTPCPAVDPGTFVSWGP